MKTKKEFYKISAVSVQPESANHYAAAVQDVHNMHSATLPVLRIDHKGRILYANKASFQLLKEWNCLANDYLPESFLNAHPQLLDMEADFDIRIETKTTRIHLDVIAFKESGYIGLYGFRTVYRNLEDTDIHDYATASSGLLYI